MARVCDHSSAGVLLRDPSGAVLLVKSGTWPPGWYAGVAGHIYYDGHSGYGEAAVAAVHEQIGVALAPDTVAGPSATGGWRADLCDRQPCDPMDLAAERLMHACRGIGHEWIVWLVDVAERPEAAGRWGPDGYVWASRADLDRLVSRTNAHALGHVTPREWAADPGLEPVWVRWLSDCGLVTVPPETLDTIEVKLNPLGG